MTCSRNEIELQSCLDEWTLKGYKVYGCKADVSTEEGRNIVLKEVEVTFNNQLDCLVNNVGFNIRKRVIDYSDDEYVRIMNTNLHSAFHLTRSMYPSFKKGTKYGASIVNIGSVGGINNLIV